MPSIISLTMRSNASVGDMRRGAGAAGDGRHQFPAIGFRRLDKAGEADIDVAHHLEHVGAMRHRRPAAAMHEIGIGRLGRREGVGLVQEAANGDTGHQCCLSEPFVRDVRAVVAGCASDEAIRCRMAPWCLWIALAVIARDKREAQGAGRKQSSFLPVARNLDCFAEPVIGRVLPALTPALPITPPSAGRARRGCRLRYVRSAYAHRRRARPGRRGWECPSRR